jgi:aminoglycoside/choline kinase family phosphotransferase
MLCALNEIETAQAAPTETTAQKCTQILDYAATHPIAKIRYYASNMILKADTDAAYLVLEDLGI